MCNIADNIDFLKIKFKPRYEAEPPKDMIFFFLEYCDVLCSYTDVFS